MLPYFENPTPYHHGLFMTGLSTVIVTRILSCPTARSSVLTMSSGGPEPSEHCVREAILKKFFPLTETYGRSQSRQQQEQGVRSSLQVHGECGMQLEKITFSWREMESKMFKARCRG